MAHLCKCLIQTKVSRPLSFLKRAFNAKSIHNKLHPPYINNSNTHKTFSISFIHTTRASFAPKDDDEDFREPADADPRDDALSLKTKDVLYPNSDDPVIRSLQACRSIQAVFDAIDEESSTGRLEPRHLCQAVVTLSDLQTAYQVMFIDGLQKYDVDSSPEAMMRDYARQVRESEGFRALIARLADECGRLGAAERVSCLFHMKKLGLYREAAFCKFIDAVIGELNSEPASFDLPMLLKYTMLVRSEYSLLFAEHAKHALPCLLARLETCEPQHVKYLTNCFSHVHLLVTSDILQGYKSKVMPFFEYDELKNDYKTILAVLQFLNLSHWARKNKCETTKLCLLLEPMLENLDISDVLSIHKIFRCNLEPATIIHKLQKRVQHHLEQIKYDDRVEAYLKLPDVLFCEITYSGVKNRMSFKEVLSDLMTKAFPSTLISLYNSMRFLKIYEENICKVLWKKMITEIARVTKDENEVLRLCTMYMFFNNNMGGNFRSSFFEDSIIAILMQMRKNGLIDFVPPRYIKFLSFYIAYGVTSEKWKNAPLTDMVEKVLASDYKLNTADMFTLSRGMDVYSKLSKKYYVREGEVQTCINDLNKFLDKCSKDLLNDDLLLPELNILCKSYIYRQNYLESDLFENIICNYNNFGVDDLSSRSIQESVYNFMTSKIVIPKFVDHSIDYVTAKGFNLYGEVLHKLLYLLYTTGHSPKNSDFFEFANGILERDKETLSGLSLLNACQSLSFFGKLSEKIANYIFSLEFMERLDIEIENCYSKFSYPKRLREQLMHLNRSVCLEYPEFGIPWFHQKHVEEVFALSPVPQTSFHADVHSYLADLLGNRNKIKKFQCSPYGYKIDFCLHKNTKNEFLLHNNKDTDNVTKVAVLLLNRNCFLTSFSQNESGQISKTMVRTGPSLMQKRHLELMGYQVVEITIAFWNSMHMTEPNAKRNFLLEKIFTV